MSSKKSLTKDDSRGSNVKQKQAGAVALAPQDPSEEVDGADDEMDEEGDEEMEEDEVGSPAGDAENGEFEVDEQAASRDPGNRDGSHGARRDESGADGME